MDTTNECSVPKAVRNAWNGFVELITRDTGYRASLLIIVRGSNYADILLHNMDKNEASRFFKAASEKCASQLEENARQ